MIRNLILILIFSFPSWANPTFNHETSTDSLNKTITGLQYKDPEYSIERLEKKITGYSVMRTSGVILLGAGAIVLPIGIVNLVKDKRELKENDESNQGSYYPIVAPSREAILGAVESVGGSALLIGGGILFTIGFLKVKHYKKRLNKSNGNLALNVNLNSITLKITF